MLIIVSLVGSYQNPCAVENGGCLGLCLLKSKSYSCSCPDGLHLVKAGNVTTCEGKVYNISFEEGRFVILFQPDCRHIPGTFVGISLGRKIFT